MSPEIIPPGIYSPSRRGFLGGLGLLAAGTALGLVLPSSVKAQDIKAQEPQEAKEKEYSPILTREGDGLFSICRFYGMSDQEAAESMAGIVKKNRLKNANEIPADRLLSLPLPAEQVSSPFRKFAFQIEGSEFASPVSMTDNAKLFQEISDNQVLYVPDWPYVFWGHSVEAGVPQDCYSFQGLLRKLRDNPEEVKIWLSRTIAGDSGTWVRCHVNKDEVKYVTGAANNDKLGDRLRQLSYNSRRIMFCTCATELKEYDRLVALATIDYSDLRNPPIAGLL